MNRLNISTIFESFLLFLGISKVISVYSFKKLSILNSINSNIHFIQHLNKKDNVKNFTKNDMPFKRDKKRADLKYFTHTTYGEMSSLCLFSQPTYNPFSVSSLFYSMLYVLTSNLCKAFNFNTIQIWNYCQL
jgi:hypothetical protein